MPQLKEKPKNYHCRKYLKIIFALYIKISLYLQKKVKIMPTKVKYKSLKPNGKNATGRPDKWTLEWAMAELNEWQNLIDKDKNILLLSDVCEKRDYAHKVFLDRTEKFKEIPEFNEFYKKLDQKLSNKYIRIMISNKFNTGAMIFLAKNRLGMADNINLDHTSKGESITSFRVEIVNGKSN